MSEYVHGWTESQTDQTETIAAVLALAVVLVLVLVLDWTLPNRLVGSGGVRQQTPCGRTFGRGRRPVDPVQSSPVQSNPAHPVPGGGTSRRLFVLVSGGTRWRKAKYLLYTKYSARCTHALHFPSLILSNPLLRHGAHGRYLSIAP